MPAGLIEFLTVENPPMFVTDLEGLDEVGVLTCNITELFPGGGRLHECTTTGTEKRNLGDS